MFFSNRSPKNKLTQKEFGFDLLGMNLLTCTAFQYHILKNKM